MQDLVAVSLGGQPVLLLASSRACALAAVTVAAETACAASCRGLAQAGERGKKAGVSQWSAGRFHRKQYPAKVITSGKIGQLS